VRVQWASVAERIYDLYRSTNLIAGFDAHVGTNLPATPPVNVFTDHAVSGASVFYRIEVK